MTEQREAVAVQDSQAVVAQLVPLVSPDQTVSLDVQEETGRMEKMEILARVVREVCLGRLGWRVQREPPAEMEGLVSVESLVAKVSPDQWDPREPAVREASKGREETLGN